MKCLDPACGSLRANELNISLNLTETEESEEVEYTGNTDYGDPSTTLGTSCMDCKQDVMLDGWEEKVMAFLRGEGD